MNNFLYSSAPFNTKIDFSISTDEEPVSTRHRLDFAILNQSIRPYVYCQDVLTRVIHYAFVMQFIVNQMRNGKSEVQYSECSLYLGSYRIARRYSH